MALSKQHYERIIFETVLNYVGYIVMYALFSWDKLYYIIKKKGNEVDVYFKLKIDDPMINKEDFIKIYERCSILKRKKKLEEE